MNAALLRLSERKGLLLPAAFFLLGLAHLSPGLDVGDAGEFLAASSTLSLAHPPAYPFYALLGKLWGTLVPLGSWAWRLNLLSLVLTTGAFILTQRSARLLGASEGSAWLGAALACLAPAVFHEALVTEVFSLHLFWAALGAWLALGGTALTGTRLWGAFGLWLGLGLGNHHTLVLLVPALFWAARARLSGTGWRGPAAGALLGLAGLSVYLYLPLRSLQDPPLDWGDPTTPGRLLHVFLRRDYGSFSLTSGAGAPEGLSSRLFQVVRFAREAWGDFGPWGLLLIGGGAAAWPGRRSGAPSLGFPLLWIVLAGPFFLALGNPPRTPELDGALGRFYALPWLGAGWLAAFGAEAAARRLGRWAPVLWLAPLLVLAFGRNAWALRWNLGPYDYGRSLLRQLPEGAAFAMDGGDDTFYSMAYLLHAEGRRPDLRPFDRGGLVFRSPYGPDFRRLSRADKELRRRQVEEAIARERPLHYSTMDDRLLPGRSLRPLGLTVGAFTPESPRDVPAARLAWAGTVFRDEPRLRERHYRHRALAPFPPFMEGWSRAQAGQPGRALSLWRQALRDGPDAAWLPTNLPPLAERLAFEAGNDGRWGEAAAFYRIAVDVEPSRAGLWTNLGAALERGGRYEEALEAAQKAVALDPGYGRARANLGALYWRFGRFDDAASAFDAAAAIEPEQKDWSGYAKRAREQSARAAKREGRR